MCSGPACPPARCRREFVVEEVGVEVEAEGCEASCSAREEQLGEAVGHVARVVSPDAWLRGGQGCAPLRRGWLEVLAHAEQAEGDEKSFAHVVDGEGVVRGEELDERGEGGGFDVAFGSTSPGRFRWRRLDVGSRHWAAGIGQRAVGRGAADESSLVFRRGYFAAEVGAAGIGQRVVLGGHGAVDFSARTSRRRRFVAGMWQRAVVVARVVQRGYGRLDTGASPRTRGYGRGAAGVWLRVYGNGRVAPGDSPWTRGCRPWAASSWAGTGCCILPPATEFVAPWNGETRARSQ
ncbi:hypothetical protein K438DRAFT_1757589 [Mycena galopus ATCC 62051]|nr:hypothetical protein K438DRAFT_1757589 [Mycena galopus ATCC 62051]